MNKTHNKLFLFTVILTCLLACVNHSENSKYTNLSGDYLGQLEPQEIPQLFAPDLISTANYEGTPTFSSDGKELYYTFGDPSQTYMSIVFMKQVNGKWTKPETCSFSGRTSFKDKNPFISPDNHRMYFTSNRPINDTSDVNDNFDIWYVERSESAWANPVRLDTIINTTDDEDCPSVSNSGTLYYSANYKSGIGSYDIYYSKRVKNKYSKPVLLDTLINSASSESYATISQDEDFILFSSSNYKKGEFGHKLYISFLNKEDATWTVPSIFDLNIQSDNWDYAPRLSHDNKYLFFSSYRSEWIKPFNLRKPKYKELMWLTKNPVNGGSDIYWVSIKIIEELKTKKSKLKK